MDVPVACSLTAAQLAVRREKILNSIRRDALRIVRIPNGYAYVFSGGSEILMRVQQLVAMESQCCGFLTFTILNTETSIHLEITGPEEAFPMIENLFGNGDAR